MTSNAYACINTDALIYNFKRLQKISSASKIMCAIKGNAYGHGIIDTAKILSITDAYVVARLSEASLLRDAGISKPITLLSGFSDLDELNEAIKLNCDVVIHNLNQVRLLEKIASKKFSVNLWLKVDTGMNRLGVHIDNANSIISKIRKLKLGSKLGLMTHLSDAEDKNKSKNKIQMDKFKELTINFDGDISFANSAVIMDFSEYLNGFNWGNKGNLWVRPGIALYGISPLKGISAKDLGLREVMDFKSKLIAIKHVSKGQSVGYNSTWVAKEDTNIGTISVGYGDGYSKSLVSGTPILINKRIVPLVGLISMDLITVDLGLDADESVGDEVVLWGGQLPIEVVANHSGLSTYALVTGVSERVTRYFI